jgi:hypothetical protein
MKQQSRFLKKLIGGSNRLARSAFVFAGLGIAVFLILGSLQLQMNYQQLISGNDKKDSIADFLIINRQLTDRNIASPDLTDEEIQDLSKQKFVADIGSVHAGRFKASIESISQQFPFYTDIAFETVPDNFVDVDRKVWHWQETSPFVPVIIPSMFLDFYNFQFAASQHLPRLTKDVVKMIVFTINIYGKERKMTVRGKVAGFSDRITSVLVPESFIKWGEQLVTDTAEKKKVSRVIIRTAGSNNTLLSAYLKSKGLATDTEKIRFSRYKAMISWVVGIALTAGLLFLIFIVIIFTLVIRLLIASGKHEIQLLIDIGTSPVTIQKYVSGKIIPPALLIVFITLSGLEIIQLLVSGKSALYFDIELSPFLSIYTAGAGIFIALLLIVVVRQAVKKAVFSDRNNEGF